MGSSAGQPRRPVDRGDDDSPKVGARLGKYRILGVLGRGGMGVCYAAEDPLMRRRVAIKVLAGSVRRGSASRFLVEAQAAGRVAHPNVVVVHDAGELDGRKCLVMELAEGGSVQDRLSREGRLPWPDAVRIAADACRGLRAAHAAGLIHRDIKPANLLIAADGSAKLSDFGLAKVADYTGVPATAADALPGTPHYMAPELFRSEAPDERSDLYSLGATFYTLLTGRVPYASAGSPAETIYAHCFAPPPDPCAVVPDVPAACTRIIARAMAKQRTDRYPDAGAMLADLEAQAGSSGPRRPSAGAEPADDPSAAIAAVAAGARGRGRARPTAGAAARRTPVLAGAVAFVLVAAAVGVLLFRGGNRPDDLPPPRDADRGKTADVDPADRSGADKSGRPATDRTGVGSSTKTPPPVEPASAGTVLAGAAGPVRSLAFSRDGRRLVGASIDGALVWDLPTADRPALRLPGGTRALNSAAFSRDGKLVAGAGLDNIVRVWSASDGRELVAYPAHDKWALSVVFSPIDDLLISSGDDDAAHAWLPLERRRRYSLTGHVNWVETAAFSPDGKVLATASLDHAVRLWNAADGSHVGILLGHSDFVFAVAFSPDGRMLATGGRDRTVRFWDIAARKTIKVITGFADEVRGLVFADGRTVLVGNIRREGEKFTGTVEFFSFPGGDRLHVHRAHSMPIWSIALSPDGSRMATSSQDKAVYLWDLKLSALPGR